MNGGLIASVMVALLVKCDWAYLKEKPHNVTPNAFRQQPFLSTLNSIAMNHVLPQCSIRSDQTKASILGRLCIVPPIYIDFIIPFGKVKYLLFHYKEELTILQQISLQVGCLVSAKVNKEGES